MLMKGLTDIGGDDLRAGLFDQRLGGLDIERIERVRLENARLFSCSSSDARSRQFARHLSTVREAM